MKRQQILNHLQEGFGALSAIGFQVATKSSLPNQLKYIQPQSTTAFFDSYNEGALLMVSLYQLLMKKGIAGVWNFVHIILTDGSDSASKSSFNETLNLMNKCKNSVQANSVKTIFLGVGIHESQRRQLQQMALYGGQDAEYHNLEHHQIENIFQRLKVSLGILHRNQFSNLRNDQYVLKGNNNQEQVVVDFKEEHFAVLFNLDISGSMSGRKWDDVRESVCSFISHMGHTDLVSGIVFNDQVKILTRYQHNQIVNTNEENRVLQPMIAGEQIINQNQIRAEQQPVCCIIM